MRETIKLRRGSFSLPLKADKIKKIKLLRDKKASGSELLSSCFLHFYSVGIK